MSELREKLAELAHSQWSGWMQYIFPKGTDNPDGTWTMPKWAVERWKRQMLTPYPELSEDEKNSDREEADKFLIVINDPTPAQSREDEALDECIKAIRLVGEMIGPAHLQIELDIIKGALRETADKLAALRSRLDSARQGDEYHTIDELYEHRFALTRALVALMPDKCVKCKKNGDGSTWEGFFVVYIETPTGQVSYHYKLEHWDDTPCREVEQWHYDGHTPAITLERLASIQAASAQSSAQGEEAKK